MKGDILEFDADVIVQQCNCITRRAFGLSKDISEKYNVNPYADRKGRGNIAAEPTKPGTVSLHKTSTRYIACLYAQFAPGGRKRYACYEKATDQHNIDDTPANRERWFAECLEELAQQLFRKGVTSVAFPHGIGCGLANGDWFRYSKMIEDWAATVHYDVTIVKL